MMILKVQIETLTMKCLSVPLCMGTKSRNTNTCYPHMNVFESLIYSLMHNRGPSRGAKHRVAKSVLVAGEVQGSQKSG